MNKTSSKYLYVKLNRDGNCFLPVKSEGYINSALYEREICRLEKGHNLFPLEYQLSARKTFPQKPRKCCLPETQASWWCHLQSTCFWSRSIPSQNMLLRDQKLDICICGYRFRKWRIPNNTSEFAFQFIVRKSCIKGRKIERLDACHMVEIRRCKMF